MHTTLYIPVRSFYTLDGDAAGVAYRFDDFCHLGMKIGNIKLFKTRLRGSVVCNLPGTTYSKVRREGVYSVALLLWHMPFPSIDN